ncbi:MAG TPA: hypothetical protein VFG49_08810 [Dyella sp.]|uniref:hypothetical protein n=1 Tax=Dyella sp. TaxID=1869338 RepID=UPI002D7A36A3|nr:hypothetical protein [Dyella sp.]HET6553624.1 hypothetical protein [Dyella sp.]
MLEIISATRFTEADFWAKSALGLSLRRMGFDTRLRLHVEFSNSRGLPDIFNPRIASAAPSDFLLFVHDDVWLEDYFLFDRIAAGLQTYEVLGVAGNRRRLPRQPAWAFIDERFTWDDHSNLSGAVAHATNPLGAVSWFGPAPAECELLDGVFLAARQSTLLERGVRFDPQFDFHFYDMDFCRTARRAGLRLGTWPICVTHQSGGAFGGAAWRAKYRLYLEKWGE